MIEVVINNGQTVEVVAPPQINIEVTSGQQQQISIIQPLNVDINTDNVELPTNLQYLLRAESGLFYPNTNPSGFSSSGAYAPPMVDYTIIKSGDFLQQINYANGDITTFHYSGTLITGVNYGSYQKQIIYMSGSPVEVKFLQ